MKIIRAGMNHQGFSFIEILQHCPTYSKATPTARYEQKVYDVADDPTYKIDDKRQAMQCLENYDRLATGVLYQNRIEKDFMSLQPQRITKQTTPVEEVVPFNIE